MIRRVQAQTGRLDAHQFHALVRQEFGEDANRIGAAADARSHDIRQTAFAREKLLARLLADDALEIAHHLRKRMRADHGTDRIQEIDRIAHVFVERAVHRILQRAGAARNGHHLAAEDFHLRDVRMLLLDVDLAHVDFAGNADQCAGRRQRHAVLPGAGLGQHLGLAHVLRQQSLAQAVVDLVRAGMVQVFTLQENARAALPRGQAPGEVQRARTTNVILVQALQLFLERLGLAHRFIGIADLVHDGLQLGRNDLAAVFAEIAVLVGHFQKLVRHEVSLCCWVNVKREKKPKAYCRPSPNGFVSLKANPGAVSRLAVANGSIFGCLGLF